MAEDVGDASGDSTDGGSADDGEEISIEPGSYGDGRMLAIWALVAELLRRLLGIILEDEVSRVRHRMDDLHRRFRILYAAAFTTFGFAIVAFVVWTLVGVVWLVENTPAPSDPVYFAAGLAVGYLASLLMGFVYSR